MEVPEQEAQQHEIQRQDKRYIEPLTPSFVFLLLNGYSSVYVLFTFRKYYDGLFTHIHHPVVVIRLRKTLCDDHKEMGGSHKAE